MRYVSWSLTIALGVGLFGCGKSEAPPKDPKDLHSEQQKAQQKADDEEKQFQKQQQQKK